MNIRVERRNNSRNKIVAAARGLFSRGLYLTCSVEDISSAAGCSRTLYYKHFKDKEEVLGAVIEDQYEWWRHHIAQLGSKSPATRADIIDWLEAFIARFAEAGEIMHLLMARSSITTRGAAEYSDRLKALDENARNLNTFGADQVEWRKRHRHLMQFILEAEWTCLNMAFADFGEDRDLMLVDLADRFLGLIGDPVDAAGGSGPPD